MNSIPSSRRVAAYLAAGLRRKSRRKRYSHDDDNGGRKVRYLAALAIRKPGRALYRAGKMSCLALEVTLMTRPKRLI